MSHAQYTWSSFFNLFNIVQKAVDEDEEEDEDIGIDLVI